MPILTLAQMKEVLAGDTVFALKTAKEIIFAIVSIVLASQAYSRFNSVTVEYASLVSSWQRAPITSMEFATSAVGCSSGYTLLSTPTWPGTQSDACACDTGASYNGNAQSSSSIASCDSNQTAAGCLSQPAIAAVDLEQWRSGYLCVRREGDAQLTSLKKKTTRPVATSAGKCSGSYKACGVGKYDSEFTTCAKSSQTLCPLTSATSADSSATPSGYELATMSMVAKDSSMFYFGRSSYTGEMPINQVKVVLSGDKRGDCFGTGTGQGDYDGKTGSYTYTNSYPAQCSKTDNRWETLDTLPEATLLSNHFALEANCTGAGNATKDYVATGTQCASDPFTSSGCMVDGLKPTEFGSCSSTDTVCKNIIYQSKCGALGRVASSTINSKSWEIQYRREIFWKSTCKASMVDVALAQGRTDSIKPSLLANLIMNIIANLILAVLFPYFLIKNRFTGDVQCISGEGEEEKKKIDRMEQALGFFFSCIKLVPALIVLSNVGGVSSTVKDAVSDTCWAKDDKLTKKLFMDLDTEIDASAGSLQSQVYSDFFNIALTFVMSAYAYYKSTKATETQVVPDNGDGDDKGAEIASPVPDEANEKEGEVLL